MSDNEVYKKQSFGKRLGYGDSMALLIIDLQRGFADPEVFGGYNIASAISNTTELLLACRAAAVPVAHVAFQVQAGGTNLGPFGVKVPDLALMTLDNANSHIVEELMPDPGEFYSAKQHSSAFFGTSLASWLLMKRVDTLLVAGCVTSGCVRASVVDASAYGLRPIVVEDCVGDRAEGPHKANLFDMEQKYADVVPLSEVLTKLKEVSAGTQLRVA